ncbi:Bacteriophage P22, NinX [uncultured Caudovirales phage]|uniref:Bacteriophage P22, NinX n=1 Tax=uncultured Caudovirales phage TaxID=2100421 RepID=A0A6J5LDV9_9CAUD|nr:Bacteriophage P22, NinX [uncultured Caudovirales phage]
MKTNTRDLVNKALDWAVTLALDPTAKLTSSTFILSYSTDVDFANVIIETYSILVSDKGTHWAATMETLDKMEPTTESGPTREIAAMQCFAVAKLGDSVEIPDELLF